MLVVAAPVLNFSSSSYCTAFQKQFNSCSSVRRKITVFQINLESVSSLFEILNPKLPISVDVFWQTNTRLPQPVSRRSSIQVTNPQTSSSSSFLSSLFIIHLLVIPSVESNGKPRKLPFLFLCVRDLAGQESKRSKEVSVAEQDALPLLCSLSS